MVAAVAVAKVKAARNPWRHPLGTMAQRTRLLRHKSELAQNEQVPHPVVKVELAGGYNHAPPASPSSRSAETLARL